MSVGTYTNKQGAYDAGANRGVPAARKMGEIFPLSEVSNWLNFNIEFWLNPKPGASGIIVHRDVAEYFYNIIVVGGWYLTFSNNKLQASSWQGLYTDKDIFFINFQTIISSNEWHHISINFKNNWVSDWQPPTKYLVGAELYLDGSLIEESNHNIGAHYYDSPPTQIFSGWLRGATFGFCQGLNAIIDEFRIWADPRTAENIAELYDSRYDGYQAPSGSFLVYRNGFDNYYGPGGGENAEFLSYGKYARDTRTIGEQSFDAAYGELFYHIGYGISDPCPMLARISKPNLIYPASGSTNVEINLTFRWSLVADAVQYVLQYGTDSTFVTATTAISTSVTYHKADPYLAIETPFYWRVKAVDSKGVPSGFSLVRGFTTGNYAVLDLIPQVSLSYYAEIPLTKKTVDASSLATIYVGPDAYQAPSISVGSSFSYTVT